MKEFLTSHSVANDIRMKRTQFFGSFLIVEGDIDARFYKNFIEQKDCQIEIAFNKANAVEVLEILQNEIFKGVIAIVDTDFDVLEEKKNENPDLFFTDFHDIECLIFVSPALEKILGEFGSEIKIKKFSKDIRGFLFEIASFVGFLRWVSLTDNLNLTFEGLEFGKFISKDDLVFNLDSFVTTVKNKSQRLDLDNAQITQQINTLASKNYDKKQVSCGKDLIEILALGLQKVLGTKSRENPIDAERIGQGLRLAYEFEFFVSTNLYQNVKNWEQENVPYRVFR